MEEWDQWRADNRSLKSMRQIALDAMAFEEDDAEAFYDYAEEHDLTVNEVAYYLNAYEYGGDAGLEAIRNPAPGSAHHPSRRRADGDQGHRQDARSAL